MSVMQALKQFAGEEGTSNFPKFQRKGGASQEQLQEAEAMMMTAPIPGQSLTQNPQSKLPYEQPSKFTDLQEFIDETFVRFTNESGLPDLLDALRQGIPVEYVAEKYLERSFRDGDINPDMLMLAIEPTIYMLISLATAAEIDPVLYPEDPMTDEDDAPTQTELYKKAAKELVKNPEEPAGDDGRVDINDFQAPTNVPTSLLARSKDAVAKYDRGGM